MFVLTQQYALLGRTSSLFQAKHFELPATSDLVLLSQMEALGLTVHPLSSGFAISDAQGYLSATDSGAIERRLHVGPWETFHPLAEDEIEKFSSVFLSPKTEIARFAKRVAQLTAKGLPIKIYAGCGFVPREGFINLDAELMCPGFATQHPDDVFVFPFANTPWGIANDAIDYVFHEDVIEHLPQTLQWQFLAEVRRVLKPGAWHRVNTPNILSAMKAASDFDKGCVGVYTGEDQWGHIAVLSPSMLQDMARIIGYREIVFNTRNGGVSSYAVADLRPSPDDLKYYRAEHVGNIFADLLK